MTKFPTEVLREWFIAGKRELPWRENPTPYRVWISEVMLQQTQVAVVIPYFERWMQAFPTIEALACAPLEHVLKCWEGLGYYSRARNLQKAAQTIMASFGGQLPSTFDELAQIPGIGPYTCGAILSFAFKQRAAAVDGNVLRVLSRFLACDEEIDRPSVKKRLQNYAEEMLPQNEPWVVSEGLIELGALVCTKKAQCSRCPLHHSCGAYRGQLQDLLPKKRARPPCTHLIRQVAVIRYGDLYAVKKGAHGKLMADLYEFPFIEEGHTPMIKEKFERAFNMQLRYEKSLPMQTHTFTRYRASLFPHLFETSTSTQTYLWKTVGELKSLPFSSGHKRILSHLL